MSRPAFDERLAAARGAYQALRHPGPVPAFPAPVPRRPARRGLQLAAAATAALALLAVLWRSPDRHAPPADWPEGLRPAVRSLATGAPPWPQAPGALAGPGPGFRLPAAPDRRHCFGQDEACPPLG